MTRRRILEARNATFFCSFSIPLPNPNSHPNPHPNPNPTSPFQASQADKRGSVIAARRKQGVYNVKSKPY